MLTVAKAFRPGAEQPSQIPPSVATLLQYFSQAFHYALVIQLSDLIYGHHANLCCTSVR